MTRPTRYKENNSSRDWIDEFCATKSVDEVRGALLFNLGKYQRRYGKKDDHLQEALKIQDYANRLVEYERSLVKPIIRELYGVTSQERAAALAAAWEEGEKRMEQIGPNGNDGLAYENEWIPSNGMEPGLPGSTRVDVRFLDGCVSTGVRARFWIWTQDGSFDDITHYRVSRPEREWIPTNGKEPRLPDGTLVDIKFADGCLSIGSRAGSWVWTQDGDSDDITHYRIHQPE